MINRAPAQGMQHRDVNPLPAEVHHQPRRQPFPELPGQPLRPCCLRWDVHQGSAMDRRHAGRVIRAQAFDQDGNLALQPFNPFTTLLRVYHVVSHFKVPSDPEPPGQRLAEYNPRVLAFGIPDPD